MSPSNNLIERPRQSLALNDPMLEAISPVQSARDSNIFNPRTRSSIGTARTTQQPDQRSTMTGGRSRLSSFDLGVVNNSPSGQVIATIKPNNSHAPTQPSKLDYSFVSSHDEIGSEGMMGVGNASALGRFSKSLDQTTTQDGMDVLRAHLFDSPSGVGSAAHQTTKESGDPAVEKFRLLKMGLNSTLSSHPSSPRRSTFEPKGSSSSGGGGGGGVNASNNGSIVSAAGMAATAGLSVKPAALVVDSIPPQTVPTDNSVTDASTTLNSINSNTPITSILKKMIAEQMSDLAGTLRNDIHNMHLELIKQSMAQQQATATLLDQHLPMTGRLMEEIERLKEENELLKLRLLSLTK